MNFWSVILRSALNVFANAAMSKGIYIPVLVLLLFYLFTQFIDTLPVVLGSITPVANLLDMIPDSMYWFYAASGGPIILKIMFTAYATRFAIRRLPLVG